MSADKLSIDDFKDTIWMDRRNRAIWQVMDVNKVAEALYIRALRKDAKVRPRWVLRELLEGSCHQLLKLNRQSARDISDDDLCSQCVHLAYAPGGFSVCARAFPGWADPDGYVAHCDVFQDNTPDISQDYPDLELADVALAAHGGSLEHRTQLVLDFLHTYTADAELRKVMADCAYAPEFVRLWMVNKVKEYGAGPS